MPAIWLNTALTAFRGVERGACHLGRLAGALETVVDLRRHLQHLVTRVLDLLGLGFGSRQQSRGDVARGG